MYTEAPGVVTEYGFTYIFIFSHGFSFIFPILSLFYSLLWFYYSSTQLCIYRNIHIVTLDQEINFSPGGVSSSHSYSRIRSSTPGNEIHYTTGARKFYVKQMSKLLEKVVSSNS
jgi:hypothetical protein